MGGSFAGEGGEDIDGFVLGGVEGEFGTSDVLGGDGGGDLG
ncbi:hypothetical protein AGMMS49593_08280 [Endomicrobiia bacterium]|nr:hypothetical protein AGMMS49593_08280 [Endomicrobiia bacterium]